MQSDARDSGPDCGEAFATEGLPRERPQLDPATASDALALRSTGDGECRAAFPFLAIQAAFMSPALQVHVCAWALCMSGSLPAGAALNLPIDAIDGVLDEQIATEHPACAAAIFGGGQLLWHRGVGLASLEHGLPIDPLRTVFDLGSTSKQFTAASVLLLVADGRLTLDDRLHRHLPELPEYAEGITIAHLLHHTSGLRDYIALFNLAGIKDQDHTSAAQALAMIARQSRLEFAPGSAFAYSNSGYFLLSLVVERVAGMSLAQFAKTRLFEPLGMSDTRYIEAHWQVIPRRATAYQPLPDGGFADCTIAGLIPVRHVHAIDAE